MLIPKGDGTYQCGPLDLVCILHDVTTDRYHAAFFEEKPLPGPVKPPDETELVRLKSKMHHTAGAGTIEGAMEHMRQLAHDVGAEEKNIWEEPQEWDGEIGIVWMVRNWQRAGAPKS